MKCLTVECLTPSMLFIGIFHGIVVSKEKQLLFCFLFRNNGENALIKYVPCHHFMGATQPSQYCGLVIDLQ